MKPPEKAAEMELLSQLAYAAMTLANRAGQIELHAAKNEAAGFDRGATNKLKRAHGLRRVAAFLDDPRLRRLIHENDQLRNLLLDPPNNSHMKPRTIPANVKPSTRGYRPSYGLEYEEWC